MMTRHEEPKNNNKKPVGREKYCEDKNPWP